MKHIALSSVFASVVLSVLACATSVPTPTVTSAPTSTLPPTDTPTPAPTATSAPMSVTNFETELNSRGHRFSWDSDLRLAVENHSEGGFALVLVSGDKSPSGELSEVAMVINSDTGDGYAAAAAYRDLMEELGFPTELGPLASQVMQDGIDRMVYTGASSYAQDIQGWVVSVEGQPIGGSLTWKIGRGTHAFVLQPRSN